MTATKNLIEDMSGIPDVTVRFINTPTGKDVVYTVNEGENLLFAGDSTGIKLPRACRTGLCGSCTVEVADPNAKVTDKTYKEGYATLRACSTHCHVPDGMDEMVVDVSRLTEQLQETEARRRGSYEGGSSGATPGTKASANPMARFDGNWEQEFKPLWEMQNDAVAVGLSEGESGIGVEKGRAACNACKGTGRIACYNCDGEGRVRMSDGSDAPCLMCNGDMTLACGSCNGRGYTVNKRRIL